MSAAGHDIDYILETMVGGNGYWQWYIVFLLWPIAMTSGFPWLLHLFTSFEPEHRCFVRGCEKEEQDHSNFWNVSFANFTFPKDYSSKKSL